METVTAPASNTDSTHLVTSSAASPQPPRQNFKCSKCSLPLEGQFVRALGGCFHLDCFQCQDCGDVVAKRFFPFEEGGRSFPLCERDYFRRLNLVCAKCQQALRGSYVTALSKKYHLDHFTCSLCETVFGPEETYYEHEGQIFCHFHYSLNHSISCGGCRMPILKQFVEVKNSQNEQWHPECYMIFKSWNIRLAASTDSPLALLSADAMKLAQQAMEEKSNRIWSILSAFEESAAACISDMLLHVSNQCYVDAVNEAGNFILHVDVLFTGIDNLEAEIFKFKDNIGLSYTREPKMLSKKIVNFFSLLSHTQDTGSRQYGTVTQELLSLVTSLAQYLKILIRIALAGALKLERRYSHKTAIGDFLSKLTEMSANEVSDSEPNMRFDDRFKISDTDVKSDLCVSCRNSVEESCIKFLSLRWHKKCFNSTHTGANLQDKFAECRYVIDKNVILGPGEASMSHAVQGFELVTQLQQYVFLLRVALKRLYGLLKVKDDSISVSYAMFPDTKSSSRMLYETGLEKSLTSLKSKSVSPSHDDLQQQTTSSSKEDLDGTPENEVPAEEVLAVHKRIEEGANFGSVHNLIESNSFNSAEHATSSAVKIPGGKAASSFAAQDQTGGSTKNLSTSLPSLTENTAVTRAKQEAESQWPASPMSPGAQANSSMDRKEGRGASLAEMGALEVFMVHHIAILKLHPMVQEYVTMKELLDVIRNRKNTFWSKIISSLTAKKPVVKDGVFGVALEVLVEKYGVDSRYGTGQGRLRIPGIIEQAITVMKKTEMRQEGIFRKNGNIKNLQLLTEKIDLNPQNISLDKEPPIQLAAMLKKFLRELPEPLMTYKLYKLFILSQKHPHVETRKKIMHYACCLLPKQNRDLLDVLLVFMKEVAAFSQGPEGNKMDISNLATVIAPNILYCKSKDSRTEKLLGRNAKEESFMAIDAVKMLITFQEEFWNVPPEILKEVQDSNPGQMAQLGDMRAANK